MRAAYAELVGNVLLPHRRAKLSHADDIFGPQNSEGAILAMLISVSSLFLAVPVVVRLRPEEQVVGAHAGAIVTAMQDAFSVRDSSRVDRPCDAVCGQGLTPEAQTAISVPVDAATPSPATVATDDVPMKSTPEVLGIARLGDTIVRHRSALPQFGVEAGRRNHALSGFAHSTIGAFP